MKKKFLGNGNALTFNKPVTFFVGENGTGKSTLIEAIAVAMGFNAEGGSRDFFFDTKNTHSDLYKYLQIIKFIRPYDGFFLRAESFYNTASYLDEPEAALSPQRLMSLLVAIDDVVNKNSQFIISTHSPILMAYPNADFGLRPFCF